MIEERHPELPDEALENAVGGLPEIAVFGLTAAGREGGVVLSSATAAS